MIITIPLYADTQLANVRYLWIVGGVEGPEQSAGITQPHPDFPVFQFNVSPPAGADEIVAYDVTDKPNNWNLGQYQVVRLTTILPTVTPVTPVYINIPLRPGTQLANIQYFWIIQGVAQPPLSGGVEQPDPDFPFFKFLVIPPPNADEIIAYDSTDITNWNLGQYQVNRLSQPLPPVPGGIIPSGIAISAPTINFKSVYWDIARRLGYNPRGDAIKEDVSQNILMHLNERIGFALAAWDWPQVNVVEWRAFRTVWIDMVQFHAGDELYYFGDGVIPGLRSATPPNVGLNAGYYTCLLDPPLGTPPTNAQYFAPLQMVDKYIAFQQQNENPIGTLLDVYRHNPRMRRRTMVLTSSPSSKGVDVRSRSFAGDVVWIRYRIPDPQFTFRPFLEGSTSLGMTFYDPLSGNCMTYTGDIGPNHVGSIIPFPRFLRGYVENAAFADCVMDTTGDPQGKSVVVTGAMTVAEQYLMMEVDNLAVQGQRLYYPSFPHRRYFGRQLEIAAGAIPTEQFAGFG